MAKWTFLLAIPLALAPLAPPNGFAQQAPATQAPATPSPVPAPQAPQFSQADLEQILAPIALYPDDLLTQALIASTYPLEVVMASRWLDQPGNKNLKGDALLQALENQEWDPSVKSLVPFPTVLKTMSDQLDWTQRVGDAFLAQQADVFAAIQTLRGRAQTAGTLKSNEQQVISQEAAAIVIQPAQPQTVFVPVYNPSIVYGAWPYVAAPPVYFPPPPGYAFGSALATGLAFGVGVAVVGSLWGWGRPSWGAGNININVNRYNNINVNRNNLNGIRNNITSNTWQHNANHRRGVAYSNIQVRNQFRPNQGANVVQREAFRGRAPGAGAIGGGGIQRPGGGAGSGGYQRLGGGAGAGGGIQRPGGGAGGGGIKRPGGAAGAGAGAGIQRPGGGGGDIQRPSGGANRPQAAQRPAGGAPAFKGVGNGQAARAQSAQGRASRANAAPARASPRRAAQAPRGGGGARPSRGSR